MCLGRQSVGLILLAINIVAVTNPTNHKSERQREAGNWRTEKTALAVFTLFCFKVSLVVV